MDRRSILKAMLGTGAAACLPATHAATPQTTPSRVPALPPLPKESVAAAVATGLTRYNRYLKGGAHTNRGESGGAPVVLALAALTGDTTADVRLLEQMRFTITGGNDISANGGYPAQHERNVTAMFTLAKLTPRIWKQLTPDEVTRVDLLMTAALVASAFTTSDHNPYVSTNTQQHALDGDANLNRGWNPNYREGMLGMLPVAAVYFGSPEQAGSILDQFHHAAFVQELEKHRLTDLHETFTWKATHPDSAAPDGPTIEKAIQGYRYLGTPITDPMALYHHLSTDTYGKTVICGLNDGQGIEVGNGTRAGMLVSGCDNLPNKGKPGMLKELNSVDAGGPRSSTLYAYDGFRVNLINQLVLVAGGLWRPGPKADECLALLRVGIPDFWYRVEHGYRNYAKGHIQGTLEGSGFVFTRPLWDAVLRPFHHA